MNSDQKLTSLIAICITVGVMFLIAMVATQGRGCSQSDDQYKKAVLTKCLDKGMDPLACDRMINSK